MKLKRWVLATCLALLALATAASAQSASVVVNGSPVAFDQPPVISDGRLLVPLRGVFEALGAGVGYDPMTRTVTVESEDRSIQLQPGRTVATMNGGRFMLDVPPKVIAGRVLVPLRFVSEALGADVRWDPATRVASIQKTAAPVVVQPPVSPPVQRGAFYNTAVPAPASDINTFRPAVRATFTDPMSTSSVRVFVDTVDMTQQATIRPQEIVWVPSYDLAPGQHRVSIEAQTPGGQPLRYDWAFNINPGLTTGLRIFSIQMAPTRPLSRGETLIVLMQGADHGQATMDVSGSRGLAMTEVVPGIYQGTYTVTERDQVHTPVTVTLRSPDGSMTQLTSNQKAALYGNPAMPVVDR
ncbi:MAG: copper amine oxidase N-terminal domain-containing protein [Armatimonadetes bacterium]|nr:copper amine oxidase N-terminal domain-containing protein [Armatimonadota bacterium]